MTPRNLARLAVAAAGACMLVRVAAEQAEMPKPMATLAGQAVEAASGEPVPEVIVSLRGARGGELRRVMADDRGRFVFARLEPGAYTIVGTKFGYQASRLGMRHPLDAEISVDVHAAESVLDLRLRMWKYAAIAGVVTDEHGEPLVDVQVRALRRTVSRGRPSFSASYRGTSGRTDDRGIFRLSELMAGEYVVAVPATQTSLPLDVMTGRGSAVDVELFSATNEFSVLGMSRNQQIGDIVLLTQSPFPQPAAVDDDGRVTVFATAFHPGVSTVSESSVVMLAPGEERTGVDFQLRAAVAARVSGRLEGPDGPLGHTALRLLPAGARETWSDRSFHTVTGLSDAAGQFTLLGVPRGQYVLRVLSPPPQGPGAASRSAPKPMLAAEVALTIGDRDVADLVVAARPAPRASGRVLVPAGSTTPLQGLLEGFFEAADAGWPISVPVHFTEDGQFDVQLPPGRYTVLVASGRPYWVASVMHDGKDISDEPIAIREDGGALDIVITLTERPSRLTGTIRDAAGSPAPYAFVVVFPIDRQMWSAPAYSPRRIAGVRATASGVFELVNLPPGEYFVAVSDGADPMWQEPKRLEALAGSAVRTTIVAGASTSVDIRVSR